MNWGNAEKVRIGGLVQLRVRVRPAQKARKGRNAATGEEIAIAAKPASVDCARGHWRGRRERCRRYRRRVVGSLPEHADRAAWPARPAPGATFPARSAPHRVTAPRLHTGPRKPVPGMFESVKSVKIVKGQE